MSKTGRRGPEGGLTPEIASAILPGMSRRKTIVFLGDGMADEPIPELGHRTPLQAAATPAMDEIARRGSSGTLLTLPEGYPTSSDVANMSVLGCDLATEMCGRGPLEALGRGISLGPDDLCFRMNLVRVDASGVLRDYSGGQIDNGEAHRLIERLNATLGSDKIRFFPGVRYRNLLVLSGPEFHPAVHCEKPDDHHGDRMNELLPKALAPEAEPTAALLRELIHNARAVLPDGRANAIWPWSGGRIGTLRKLTDRFGITGAVISAVDVIAGLGRALGLEVISVPGATGYIDTNYEGKADAALEAIQYRDFVYVHVEGIDEVSHEQRLDLKLKAIEDFDRRLIGRVMARAGSGLVYAVLPDHPVPIRHGKHTRTPVPVAVCGPGIPADAVQTFDELACRQGGLGAMKGDDFVRLLFGPPRF